MTIRASVRLSRFVSMNVFVSMCVLVIPPAAGAQQPSTDPTPHPAAASQPAPGMVQAQETLPAQVQPPSPQPADPPAPKPPVFNRVNERLPGWLRVRGEFRERMEGFEDAGFRDGRDDLYWLSRVRFDTIITPSQMVRVHLQVQDARVARKTIGPTGSPFSAPFDLRMGYADLGAPDGPITLRVGRQELVYGEQRLVGHVSWVNAARTFDAAKVTLRAKAFQVEAFGASVVRIQEDGFDRSGHGNRFAGAYLTTGRILPGGSVEPYVYWRRDVDLRSESGSLDDLNQTTAGIRLAGPLPARLDYDVELAVQRGSLGSDEVRAWAGHGRLRKMLAGRGAVRATAEYNYASGDADPIDGVRGTFDQLYPTGHDKYGLADQVGWRNIHHVRTGLEFTPVKKWPLAANYHSWWLAERRDALYTAGSLPIARIAAGAASRHVGQELDLQLSHPLTPQLQLAAGYAHIFTGGFLKEATPGASYSHPYVMVTYVFLAEK